MDSLGFIVVRGFATDARFNSFGFIVVRGFATDALFNHLVCTTERFKCAHFGQGENTGRKSKRARERKGVKRRNVATLETSCVQKECR